MTSAKWRPFCLGLNLLNVTPLLILRICLSYKKIKWLWKSSYENSPWYCGSSRMPAMHKRGVNYPFCPGKNLPEHVEKFADIASVGIIFSSCSVCHVFRKPIAMCYAPSYRFFVCSHQDALDDYDIICFHGDQQSTIGVKKKVEENLYRLWWALCLPNVWLIVGLLFILSRFDSRLLL